MANGAGGRLMAKAILLKQARPDLHLGKPVKVMRPPRDILKRPNINGYSVGDSLSSLPSFSSVSK